MADKVVLFFGSSREFEELVQERIGDGEVTVGYLDSIRIYNTRIRATEYASFGGKLDLPESVDNCVVRADDFGSVVSHVISSFATILKETYDIGTLFVQNPPRRALNSLLSSQPEESIERIDYSYPKVKKKKLKQIYSSVEKSVLGQDECKKSIITSLYKLSVLNDTRPSVLLFYGPSGVGKTETAKCFSEAMGGGLTRIQFSMMQTNEAYEYLFGAEHSKSSFARDLLGRESNVVLIDEFDKVSPSLYNMFYQLFDEGRYIDTNYDVDMKNGLFLLTSNFSSENEVKRVLGSAIFSRIGECIRFVDLADEDKRTIAVNHYKIIVQKLDKTDQEIIERTSILSWFEANAGRYDNMRIMKTKLEKAIFEKLASLIVES